MLCKCQIPARRCPQFFVCGYTPQRCKMFAKAPLIPDYGRAVTNLTSENKDRFVAFELVLSPVTKEESFYVKPLDYNDVAIRAILDAPDRWPEVLYNTKRHYWLFPFKYYREVLQAVKEGLGRQYAIYEVPEYVLEFQRKCNAKSERLKRELYETTQLTSSSSSPLVPQSDDAPSAAASLSHATTLVKTESDGGFRSTGGYVVPDWAKPSAAVVSSVHPSTTSASSSAAATPKIRMPTEETDDLFRKLHPFQKEGVRFVLEHGGKAMIADEMGLGKTVQAICAANIYNHEWPALVICPASLCDNWAREFNKWLLIPKSMVQILRPTSQAKKKASAAGGATTANKNGIDLSIASVVIVGYQNVKLLPAATNHYDFKVVILDECHYIKNSQAQRTKETQIYCNNATRTILLSGTPAMSRPYELFPQLQILNGTANIAPSIAAGGRGGGGGGGTSTRSAIGSNPLSASGSVSDPNKFFMSEFQYSSRYCGGHYKTVKWAGGSPMLPEHGGHSNTDELNMLLKHYIIRRCKRDVLGEMPAKTRKCLYLTITEKELKQLEHVMGSLRKEVSKAGGAGHNGGNNGNGIGFTLTADMLQYKIHTAKAKVPAVKDYLKDVLTELVEQNQDIAKENEQIEEENRGRPAGEQEALLKPRKIILFGHHIELLAACANVADAVLAKHGFEYIRISGETSMSDREALGDRFRTHPKCCIAILSMQAMGTGHTFTCANKVIFTELDWNPSTHLQCEDRVHRIGQDEECLIEYLLADGTTDEVIWPLLQSKLDVTLSMIANSANDQQSLGGGAGLQDKSIVQRSTPAAAGAASSSAGGGGGIGGSGRPTTLDGWVIRKENTTSTTTNGPRSRSPTPVPAAAAEGGGGAPASTTTTANTNRLGVGDERREAEGEGAEVVMRCGSQTFIRPKPFYRPRVMPLSSSSSAHNYQRGGFGGGRGVGGGAVGGPRATPPPPSAQPQSTAGGVSLSQQLDMALRGQAPINRGQPPPPSLPSSMLPASPQQFASPTLAPPPSQQPRAPQRTFLDFSKKKDTTNANANGGIANSVAPLSPPAAVAATMAAAHPVSATTTTTTTFTSAAVSAPPPPTTLSSPPTAAAVASSALNTNIATNANANTTVVPHPFPVAHTPAAMTSTAVPPVAGLHLSGGNSSITQHHANSNHTTTNSALSTPGRFAIVGNTNAHHHQGYQQQQQHVSGSVGGANNHSINGVTSRAAIIPTAAAAANPKPLAGGGNNGGGIVLGYKGAVSTPSPAAAVAMPPPMVSMNAPLSAPPPPFPIPTPPAPSSSSNPLMSSSTNHVTTMMPPHPPPPPPTPSGAHVSPQQQQQQPQQQRQPQHHHAVAPFIPSDLADLAAAPSSAPPPSVPYHSMSYRERMLLAQQQQQQGGQQQGGGGGGGGGCAVPPPPPAAVKRTLLTFGSGKGPTSSGTAAASSVAASTHNTASSHSSNSDVGVVIGEKRPREE